MEGKEINALILDKYGELPHYSKKPIPVPKEGQLLVKVEASTINPSDKFFLQGKDFKRPVPTTPGILYFPRKLNSN